MKFLSTPSFGIRFTLIISLFLAILLGVGIHQIPVSLSLAALMRESRLKRSIQILFLSLFAIAAPLGYLLSDIVLSNVSEITVGLAAAFAGGSLLYIATTDLLPVIHATSKNKYASISAFLTGVIIMSLFASHHHHEHESHDGHTDMEHQGE